MNILIILILLIWLIGWMGPTYAPVIPSTGNAVHILLVVVAALLVWKLISGGGVRF